MTLWPGLSSSSIACVRMPKKSKLCCEFPLFRDVFCVFGGLNGWQRGLDAWNHLTSRPEAEAGKI